MIRSLCAATLALLLSAMVLAQSAPKPTFDSADVHGVAAGTLGTTMSGGVLRSGQYEVHSATMVDLIRIAYSVDADLVLGGPRWLEMDRFDVVAKAPTGA